MRKYKVTLGKLIGPKFREEDCARNEREFVPILTSEIMTEEEFKAAVLSFAPEMGKLGLDRWLHLPDRPRTFLFTHNVFHTDYGYRVEPVDVVVAFDEAGSISEDAWNQIK